MEHLTKNKEKISASSKSTPFFKPFVQKKLSVGASNDHYEIEAENMANKVMGLSDNAFQKTSTSEAKVQRKCAVCEEEEKKIQRKPLCESIQRVSYTATEKSAIPSNVESSINNSKGKGSKMDSETQSFMENRFGADFSGVKIHTGNEASSMSQNLNAKAFTVGNDIYFNNGQYNPSSNSGKHLLAHELTHTLQQGNGFSENYIQRDLAVDPPNPTAVARELSDQEIQEAISFNRATFRNTEEIRNLRDVLGLNEEPAIIDEDFVNAVVQWQAENNLTQDGKIGARTARVVGHEMMEESTIVPAQRRPAIQMLERGISMWLSGDRYNDTATTSQKLIQFNAFIPQGLNLRDYAFVNFIRGSYLDAAATPLTVQMYGANVPFNFAAEQVDSVDNDPIYWSDASARWNYNISGRTISATDNPGRTSNAVNLGDVANIHFRISLFRVADLPNVTAGNVGAARPLFSLNWTFSVTRNALGITHP